MTEIKKIDLASVAMAQGVELKAAGLGRLRGLCPFHNERTPSFFVFSDNNRFYCFGCHEQGDSVDFVRRMHGFGFREALSFLGIERSHPKYLILRRQLRLQSERRDYEWKERELAWTLGTAIRLCHKALGKLTRENFDSPEMALILTELCTLYYQHDLLICGDPVDRAELVRDLAGLRLFNRRLLFRRDFEYVGWLRQNRSPNGQ